MTEQEFLEKAADFVGREMNTLTAAAFLQDVAADAMLRTRLDELLAADRALRLTLLDPREAQQRTASMALPALSAGGSARRLGSIRPFQRRWASLLGLAAAVALAFAGGYSMRGGASVEAEPETFAPARTTPVLGVAELERFARAQREFPHASRFGQALLTLASRTARP